MIRSRQLVERLTRAQRKAAKRLMNVQSVRPEPNTRIKVDDKEKPEEDPVEKGLSVAQQSHNKGFWNDVRRTLSRLMGQPDHGQQHLWGKGR